MAGFPKAGDEYGGRYRIVRQIGHGGMGSVYEAVDKVLRRPVALKIVLPGLDNREDYQARFAREAAVLAKIRSRHIVGIHEYGEDEDTVYFVTELFPDGDLQTWLARNGPLDRVAALTLVAQVCEALADAHAVEVIHRDVKPGNVLLWSRPEGLIPYLCDFGIALDGQQGLTRTGTLVGSPAYMAPERHFGHPADERGDLYSTGCLLWAALTGDAPYSGTDFQMMNAHINEPTPQLRTGHPVDDQIDEVLAEALHKDPERRIPSAAEMRRRLLAIVATLQGHAPPPVPAAPPPPAPPRTPPGTPPAAADPPTRARPLAVPPVVSGEEGPEPAAAVTEDPVASGPSTVIREAVPPPPARPAADAPAPGAAPSRRGAWAALAAVVALLLVGGLAWAIAAGGEEEPRADDPAPATPASASPSPSADTTPSGVPLSRPAPPQVQAAPAYRAVRFRVTSPAPAESADGVEHSVEYRDDGAWEEAGRQVVLPTRQGGDRACLTARTVATDGGATRASRPARACGTAAPRTVQMVRRAEDPCTNSQGGPCTWYDVRVTGFAGPATPLVVVRRLDGSSFCAPFACDFDRIRIGADGRGYLRHDWKISRDEGRVVLDVAGVTATVRVYH